MRRARLSPIDVYLGLVPFTESNVGTVHEPIASYVHWHSYGWRCMCVISFIYPATCGPKGHGGSSAPVLLLQIYPYPVPDGVSAIIPGAPLSPSPQVVGAVCAHTNCNGRFGHHKRIVLRSSASEYHAWCRWAFHNYNHSHGRNHLAHPALLATPSSPSRRLPCPSTRITHNHSRHNRPPLAISHPSAHPPSPSQATSTPPEPPFCYNKPTDGTQKSTRKPTRKPTHTHPQTCPQSPSPPLSSIFSAHSPLVTVTPLPRPWP